MSESDLNLMKKLECTLSQGKSGKVHIITDRYLKKFIFEGYNEALGVNCFNSTKCFRRLTVHKQVEKNKAI